MCMLPSDEWVTCLYYTQIRSLYFRYSMAVGAACMVCSVRQSGGAQARGCIGHMVYNFQLLVCVY